MESRRLFLEGLFRTAVAAAHPEGCLRPHLPAPPSGRLIILAAGKAAGSMAQVAERHYVEERGMPPGRISGLAVTRRGYGCPTGFVRVVEAGHPLPDAAGLAASIVEINTVRKHLSHIKGGRLAQRAFPAPLVAVAISDVPGDDPAVIGSGPTVPDPTTLADARAILARRGLTVPRVVAQALGDPANETPKTGDPVFIDTSFELAVRPADVFRGVERAARAAGYDCILLGTAIEGEAREVALTQARLALDLKEKGRRAVILSGGELTVTLRGRGRGGPNQEYALALAVALARAAGIAALAGDTDGTDGGGGRREDPAGAFIDGTTLVRAADLGLDPAAFLRNNNSTEFFEKLGDLLTPGPTLTNVNDFRAILVDST